MLAVLVVISDAKGIVEASSIGNMPIPGDYNLDAIADFVMGDPIGCARLEDPGRTDPDNNGDGDVAKANSMIGKSLG